jgi:uncharacterized protein (TIGR03437 family)
MRGILVLLLTFSFPLWSQFSELAATDDGGQLYFSSNLTFADMPPSRGESRVYRVGPEGIQLFAERGLVEPTQTFTITSGGARMPQVSGDGLTVGFTLEGVGILRGVRNQALGEGSLQMSRNGKWALLLSPNGRIIFDPATTQVPLPQTPVLINLETGERTAIPPPPSRTFALASDGTAVVINSTPSGVGLGLWRQGQFSPLDLRGFIQIWSISDNARALLYTMSDRSGEFRLMLRDLATGRDATLFSSADRFVLPMGLSNDGQWVLFRVADLQFGPEGPGYIVNTVTGETQPLTLPDGELAADGTLSGSGNAAFLVTSAGRIVRFELDTGRSVAIETLVPTTPYVRKQFGFSPGSLVRLEGTLPRSVEQLTGHILLGERPMPVLFARQNEIGVQVPWELRNTTDVFLRLDLPSDSPFRQNESTFTSQIAPKFEPLNPGESSIFGFKIVSADFSGLLTVDPQPGEICHIYMTGLGPVRGQVQTGVPAPLGSMLPIEGNIRCRFSPYTADAETLFAGLAPGLTGVYQVTFQMPTGPNPGRLTGGNCKVTSQNATANVVFALVGGNPIP